MAKLDPPRLSIGGLSGRVFVTTHGKIRGHDEHGRELIESSVKYDVTSRLVLCPGCGRERWQGFGPCSYCGTESEWARMENERINAARAERGLPPLADEKTQESQTGTPAQINQTGGA